MNKYLEQLIELSNSDKTIDSYEPKIEQVKANLNKELEKESSLRNKIESIKEELKENELKKQKNEQHLAELSEKLKSFSKKSSLLKTEKEIKALQLEEEIAKEQIDFANEEIERLNKIKDNKESEILELEETLAEVSKEVESAKKEIEKELVEIEKERMKEYEKKQKLISKMNQNVLIFYEKIRRWAGNTTVVPIKKQACYGCYMRINDQIYSDVIRAEDITTCPHCGRILYKEVEKETEEVES